MERNEFLRTKFLEYYTRNEVKAPPQIDKREFGTGIKSKIEFRHLSFKNPSELNAHLRQQVPFFISFSAGYYQFPTGRPMKKKIWQGADLVFDLDAHDFETGCKHPSKDICDVCMTRVKDETIKLIENFLIPDFGFSMSDLNIVFSGNQGYHIHIRTEDVRSMPQNARKEISDYIAGIGIDPEALGWKKFKGSPMSSPAADEWGWASKINSELQSSLTTLSKQEFNKKFHVPKKVLDTLYDNVPVTLTAIQDARWAELNLTLKQIESLVKAFALKLAVNIDKNVTMDVSRLMRLPGSIHGGTGFVAMSLKSIDSFDPFKDPIAFSHDPVKVKALKDFKVILSDEVFELKEGEEKELPEFVVVYGVCKEVLELR